MPSDPTCANPLPTVIPCQPPLRESHFQVAVMGEISDEEVSRFVGALGDVCGEHLPETGRGARA